MTTTRCKECFNFEDFCTCHRTLWTPEDAGPEGTAVLIGLEMAATIFGSEDAKAITDAVPLTEGMVEELAFAMGDPVAAAEQILMGEEPW